MQDKNHSRAIKALKVYCTTQPSCTWEGDLEGLVHHLSKKGDCQYVQLPCKHQCGASVQRSELIEHEDKKCIKRPFICEHCHEYSSTWEDVTTVHYNTCYQVPVECPNKCGDTVPRGSLDEHQTTSCPLKIVECELAASFLCQWKGNRKDLDDHMKQEWKEHVLLMASSHTKSIEELSAKLEQKESKIQELHQELMELRSRCDKLESEQVVSKPLHECKPPKLTSKFDSSKDDDDDDDIEDDSDDASSCVSNDFPSNTFPFFCRITHASEAIKSKKMITTRPFYYGPTPGYMMKACIHLDGHDGRGTYVSVYVRLCPNKNNSKLIWPFNGSITIRLKDQLMDENHFEKVIDFKKAPFECTMRPLFGIENDQYGFSQFIRQDLLSPYYLVKNSIIFEIPEMLVHRRC